MQPIKLVEYHIDDKVSVEDILRLRSHHGDYNPEALRFFYFDDEVEVIVTQEPFKLHPYRVDGLVALIYRGRYITTTLYETFGTPYKCQTQEVVRRHVDMLERRISATLDRTVVSSNVSPLVIYHYDDGGEFINVLGPKEHIDWLKKVCDTDMLLSWEEKDEGLRLAWRGYRSAKEISRLIYEAWIDDWKGAQK